MSTVLINLGGYQPTGAEFFGTAYFELDFSPPAPPVGGLVRLVVPQPVLLPDPKILCEFSNPKPCGDELDCRNYEIQSTKGVHGTYK